MTVADDGEVFKSDGTRVAFLNANVTIKENDKPGVVANGYETNCWPLSTTAKYGSSPAKTRTATDSTCAAISACITGKQKISFPGNRSAP